MCMAMGDVLFFPPRRRNGESREGCHTTNDHQDHTPIRLRFAPEMTGSIANVSTAPTAKKKIPMPIPTTNDPFFEWLI